MLTRSNKTQMTLKLASIYVYPIKSLGGVAVSRGVVQPGGLRHDRRMMLVDVNGEFITQREYPELSHLTCVLSKSGNMMRIWDKRAPELNLEVTLGAPPIANIRVKVWSTVMDAGIIGNTCDDFFSTFLHRKCQLVKMTDQSVRYANPFYAGEGIRMSMADGYPLMIIGQSSLSDLNSRLAEKVEMQRFRPNLVFKGGIPYEEDTWKEFMIGDIKFKAVKPCSRCVITTIHPESGIKGIEPLTTLSHYRKKGNNVLFGMNLVALSEGEIRTGEKIKIL